MAPFPVTDVNRHAAAPLKASPLLTESPLFVQATKKPGANIV
jgi:hypothetical protein